MQNTLL